MCMAAGLEEAAQERMALPRSTDRKSDVLAHIWWLIISFEL